MNKIEVCLFFIVVLQALEVEPRGEMITSKTLPDRNKCSSQIIGSLPKSEQPA